ncbi:YnfU family zinc-binding protein [Citrobacter koseri]|uniref:YnfU family zinc-binding protein n=2 Tax=Citrobacter koseri TaxID=545 RepID=UPI0028BD2EFC|nr:YnfU family zinc-binding protein [Citrobacter koseri]MDT7455293.1 YnfU family zinc-binding protein [Citrobacter koseri]MDT7503299.1 YnfU family zinc-binding protein [Citrobacter koseri]
MKASYFLSKRVWSQPYKNRKQTMSGRRDTKNRRNHLVKCPCPACSKDSEHSFTRIQKGTQLICPYCSTLFQSASVPSLSR